MKKGLIVNEDIWPMIDELDPEEKAELLDALSAYYQGNEAPEISRIVNMLFKRIALDNTRFDPEHRQALSEIRAEAGKKGGSKPKQNKQTEANESKKSKIAQDKIRKDKEEIREEENREYRAPRFTPPTLQDVEDYAYEKGLDIDAERFVDFYASKGWKVGSSPMKDWRAAARNWARDGDHKKKSEAPVFNFDQRHTDYDALLSSIGL